MRRRHGDSVLGATSGRRNTRKRSAGLRMHPLGLNRQSKVESGYVRGWNSDGNGRSMMRRTAALLVMLAAALADRTGLSLPVQGAQSPTGNAGRTRIDVSKLGPQVGQQVPDFSLPDQTGKTWTRESIVGRKGAMLVFYRSADW